MKEEIKFRLGDRVYAPFRGYGVVTAIHEDACVYPIEVTWDDKGKTGFFEEKREHSRKPVQMREMIEKVSYPPFIELFARERFDGWDAWGNEICFTGKTRTADRSICASVNQTAQMNLAEDARKASISGN